MAERAEERLHESEARLSAALAIANLGTFEWDLRTDAVLLDARSREIFGFAPGEGTRAQDVFDRIDPRDFPRVHEAARASQAALSRLEIEYRIRLPDGSLRHVVSISDAVAGADGRAERMRGVFGDVTARKLADERQHATEDQLRRLADALPILVSYIDKDERYGFVNQLYEEWFGTPRETLLGRTIREVLGDEAYAIRRPQVEAALRGETTRFEAVTPTVDGGRDTELHYIPSRDANGTVEGFYVLVTDMTDRKRAERALDKARAAAEREAARTSAILAQLAEGVIVTDTAGRITFINDAAIHIHGVERLGVAPEDYAAAYNIFTEDGRPFPSQELPLARAVLHGETIENARWHIHRPDGRRVVAIGSARPILTPEGERVGAVLTVRDDTDRANTEAALQSLNASLEAQVAARTAERDRIWENSNELMAVFAFDGRRLAVNPSWSRVLGYDEETLVHKPMHEITHPDDVGPLREAVGRLARGERIDPFEDRLRHADGSYRVISWTGVPGDGVFYAIGRDVTEHRHAEEALRQAQKMEAVGQLTGGVAHDFNNLLTIIRSSVDFLRRRDLPEERRRRYVDAINETVDRASKLTGQLLAFARRQALKPEVFDAAKRVKAAADMLRTIVGSRIRIELDVACESCLVEADISQFETALLNMAANARDAMGGDGTLTVRVEERADIPALSGEDANTGRFVAVSLTDTGSGIPPESLPHIFEPFYTTKGVGKGTGLGLSQVYGFAKQSGGDVGVESEVGRGTTFTLYLPRAAHGLEEPLANGSRAAPTEHGHGRRVLVVEDNIEVGTFSTQLLQDLGYETTWASNGDQALALLEQGLTVDIVFSDVVMPGMGGVELGHEIRRRYPGLPIVLTSGYSHVLAEEGRHGFELLHKPYAAEELSRVLRRVMRARGAVASS